jgi:hypothetical protein
MSDLPTVSDIDCMQGNPSSENDPEKAAADEAGTKPTVEVKPPTVAVAAQAPADPSHDPTDHESQLPEAITGAAPTELTPGIKARVTSKFPTVGDVFNASNAQLDAIDFIGPTRVAIIRHAVEELISG